MLKDLHLVLCLLFCSHLGIIQSVSWVMSRMGRNLKINSPFQRCDTFYLLANNSYVPPPPITVGTLAVIFVNSFFIFVNDWSVG